MKVERPFFLQGLLSVSRVTIFHAKGIRNRRRVFRLPRRSGKYASVPRFANPKMISAQTKLRGKSKEGGRSPLLGRFKGDCQGGESKLPLDYSFFRPSTAFSFPCGKESGVENAFLPRQKRYGPRSGGDGAPNQTAPSAHSNAGLKPPLRKHKAAKAFLTNGAAPSRARLLLSYRSTFSKRPADVWKASVLSSSQTAAPPSRIGSCRSWSCRA